MSDKYDILLLQIISRNGKIDSLTNSGLEYSQIAKKINFLFDNNLITTDSSDNLILTDNGIERINDYSKKTNQSPWISPLNEYQVEQIGEFDVYLPKKVNF